MKKGKHRISGGSTPTCGHGSTGIQSLENLIARRNGFVFSEMSHRKKYVCTLQGRREGALFD
jgi:hypothetical protein